MEIPRVRHLILLVGSNPLPNAVAGKLLVEAEGIITLVHSSDSFSVAQRLKEWLEREHQKKDIVKLKEVKESEPSSICQGVRKCLEEVQGRSIGLNYTGGTKMMSVQAYRAVEQWAKDKGITPVFSYLDARALQMVFEPTDGYLSERRIYVGREVMLSLEDFLALHGWRLRSEPNNKPVLYDTAQALAIFCSRDADSYEKWNSWIKEELLSKCKRPTNLNKWKSKTELMQITLSCKEEMKGIFKSLLDDQGKDLPLTHSAFKDDPIRFCSWLHGIWLEHYVLGILNKLKEDLQLGEVAQNVETEDVKFEVDVVAICGYQLFAFSCSTSNDRKILKQKLFEAYVRAQQLGGDEARVALICCAEDPAGLEQEIRRDFDCEGRVRVFGRKQLADLAFHIEDWIKSQSGGE
ncbi:protein of unknown function [Caldanaerovirga acetigignens]|uniref:DUF1887 domain-containing protein n=1 Tax=Caldanaerovirga acetigignens TaxID=447595 RepID=A0A1M7MME7_9FIRM|nr:DUF1887 family CARF protein [Caldanaerovirga acetigignens]SHM92179.1 protein of unknown function [Caldanaerovirga acetigignens]